MRDINKIIASLVEQFPTVQVEQLKVLHPGADDDGLWFFREPSSSFEVQLESSSGNCPFLFETTEHPRALQAGSINEAVQLVAVGLGLRHPGP